MAVTLNSKFTLGYSCYLTQKVKALPRQSKDVTSVLCTRIQTRLGTTNSVVAVT